MSDEQGQRPSFYEEQYLGAADLNAVVDHGRLQMAQHLLGTHTWGIVTGLELAEKPSPLGGGQVDLFVLPGFAWDGFGRPIAVLRPTPVPAEALKAYDYDAGTDGGTPAGRLIEVWLRYDEVPAQPPRAGFGSCSGGESYARVQETFRLEVGQRASHGDRHLPITVGGVTDPVDAQQVLQQLNPQTPPVELFDESVPYQDLPDDPKARWLIPLGAVRWLPNSDATKPGRFEPRTDEDLKKSLSLRHYAGVVAGSVNAADRSIRLRSRTKDYSAVASDDLVWVEGDLRVEGDARLFDGELSLLAQDGQDGDVPLCLRRSAGAAGTDLRVVIGQASAGVNSFQVGPLDAGFQARLTVRDDGKVGIGTTTPRNPLAIRAIGSAEELISFEDANRQTKWHINQRPQNKPGLNFAETRVADGRLFIRAGGNVGIGTTEPELKLDVRGDLGRDDGAATLHLFGSRIGDVGDGVLSLRSGGRVVAFDGNDQVGIGTRAPNRALTIQGNAATYLNVKANDGAQEILLGADTNGGIVSTRTNHDLQLRSGSDQTRLTIKADGKVGIGTTAPNVRLHVLGDLTITGTARKPGGGFWTNPSDQRLKKNIEPLHDVLSKLLQLHGVRFEWQEPEAMGGLAGLQVGLVAQEVEQVFPEWVSTGPDGYKELTIQGFEALVVEALRELKAEIDSLKGHLQEERKRRPRSRKSKPREAET